MHMFLVRGIPGSGKSTFAAKMFPGVFHIENDMFHIKNGEYRFDAGRQKSAVSWCMDMCRTALANDMDVVVSNTFTKRRYVKAYMLMALEAGAEFTVYKMNGSFENSHSVPEDVKKNMAAGWEDWNGEICVYPNMNFDKDDPACRLYMLTKLKVGDHVLAERRIGGIDVVHITADDPLPEMEKAEAVVTDIRQGTYDYLNVYLKFLDNGKAGIAMSGDLEKIPTGQSK